MRGRSQERTSEIGLRDALHDALEDFMAERPGTPAECQEFIEARRPTAKIGLARRCIAPDLVPGAR